MSFTPFLLFGGAVYYANGGWCDYRGSFATIEAAIAALESPAMVDLLGGPSDFAAGYSWWHVVDVRTMTIVAASPMPAY